jgi:hypothetical protein
MPEYRTRIRVAGNTAAPALYALRAKGYVVTLSYVRLDDGGRSSDYVAEYAAEKDGCLFSATTAEELLGLVAMWEVRGDGWRACTDLERAWHDALVEAALVYDRAGNLVDEDGRSG